ncbi:hypothetical protein GM415_17760 [Pseudodesulfovibrio cashew]|uniref:Uncharacterized protein n=1 Tax=Pseudodesulfovibrio cashew TaxID=2678688 RepID=A0A6I6JL17_9BACT|nr:hypothetical protein [Pseudodesulfovibrio cashew]QGY41889.1 hypothetical protein GM415_17760 [Pseudodesulfovibrio cashew]
MKRTLVIKGEIDQYICSETKTFYAEEGVILTPGAKDELSRRGIAMVRGERPEPAPVAPATPAAACGEVEGGVQDLLVAVAALVKTEFDVEDPELIKAISCQAVKTLMENL